MQKQYYDNSPTRPGTTTPPQGTDDDAEKIIQTWKRDAAIRAEFGSVSTYAAWYRADKAGKIRILGAPKK